ncbi:MAG: SGNH/GDSL hydrolase family protein [Ruminococcaceae bacterium]|nr:SGNH/GDSL hydrolase family protein [Oscillospiraceae bacterium]
MYFPLDCADSARYNGNMGGDILRKAWLILLVCTLIFSSVPISAEEEEADLFLLALGDSITTGYELEGGRYGNAGYVNLAAQALGLTRESYENRAVNGFTTADLIELLPSCEEWIRKADIIVFDIGYNDILGHMYSQICMKSCGEILSMPQLQDAWSDMEDAKRLNIENALEKVDFTALYKQFEERLSSVLGFLQAQNSDAVIYMQSLYNPLAGLGVMEEFSDSVIRRMNSSLKQQADAYGCRFMDVYAAFSGHAEEYTYINRYDIHPNEAGHQAIFDLFAEALRKDGFLPDKESAAETSDSVISDESENSGAKNNLLSAVLILTACITIGLICVFVHRKSRRK